MHWKLTVSYNGTGFHGWQVQPGLRTVQGALAASLRETFGEDVLPQGSGRTDTGVHALAQVCSFSLHADVPAANLMRALNRVLPESVRVTTAEQVDASFHARHSARRKTYEYRIFERRRQANQEQPCSPFLAPFVWDCRWPLSLERMQAGSAHFVGTQDFTSFAATDLEIAERNAETAQKKGNVRSVSAAGWHRSAEDQIVFRITGNGFLHHMVRNIVGTLADVGRGALEPDDVPKILAAKSRAAAGPTAPAQGLFLVDVSYDEEAASV